MPTYYIFGGMVFCPLSKDLLNIWGSQWYQSAPRELACCLLNNVPEREGEQVVVLLKVLATDVNEGYQDISNWVVDRVNGEKIWNMVDLVEKIEKSSEPYIVLEDKYNKKIIIDRDKAINSSEDILEIYRIPSDRSNDL